MKLSEWGKEETFLSVERNNAAKGLQKLNFVERQPLNTGVLLLANEEFEKEKGGYDSDDTEKKSEEWVKDDPSGSKEDPKNRKRKPPEKLKSSEKMKRLCETPAKRKRHSRKKKKTESNYEDNVDHYEESAKLSEKNDTSMTDVKRNDEVQERSKDKETKKGPSRSSRRKYAKRVWLREMAKTAISEGLVSYHMEDASGSKEDPENQKRKAPEKLEGSEEKKQRSEASEVVVNDGRAPTKRKHPSQNEKKTDSNYEDNVEHNEESAKLSEKNDVSMPDVKRNRGVFDNRRDHHVGIYMRIKAMLAEVLRGFEPSEKGPTAGEPVLWEAPPHGWVKLNCDGSVLYDTTNSAAAGGVIRDKDGIWILGFAMRLGDCTIIQAELLAIQQGLILAWEKRLPKILVESDSDIVVNLILSNDTPHHPLQNILEEVRRLLRLPWDAELRHRRRNANKVADALARSGHFLDAAFLTWDDPPSSVLSRLEKDRLQAAWVLEKKKNDEVQENAKETEAAEIAPKETRKITSRNFRRKYAKRLWMREIAKIQKTASESEGLTFSEEAEALVKEAIKEQMDRYLHQKEPNQSGDKAIETIIVGDGDEQSNQDGGIHEQTDKGNTDVYEQSNHIDDVAETISCTKLFSKEAEALVEEAIQEQMDCFLHQKKPNQNGDKAKESILVGDGDEQSNQDGDAELKPDGGIHEQTNKRNTDLSSQQTGGAQPQPDKNGNASERSNQESIKENEAVPVVMRTGYILFEPLGKEQAAQQNHELSGTFQWNGITSKKQGEKWWMERCSFCSQNDHESSNNSCFESSSDKKENQQDRGIDFDKLQPLPSTPKADEDEGVPLDTSLYKEDGSLEIDLSPVIDVCVFKPETSEPIDVASSHVTVPGVEENTTKPVLPSSNGEQGLKVRTAVENGRSSQGSETQPTVAGKSGVDPWDEILEALNAKKEKLAKKCTLTEKGCLRHH